jgi:hypothetical protein
MKIRISTRQILAHAGTKYRNYCVECGQFYAPATLEQNPHATHYNLLLPSRREELGEWLERVKTRDERAWGVILDEHGTRAQAFCPSDLEIELLD